MRTFDTRSWLIWLVVSAVIAIFSRNPFYLIILLLISRFVMAACQVPEASNWRLPFWRIASFILIFSTLFNWLIAHVGESVIFSLPNNWPIIGGPLTLEAAVFGFLNGLSLVVLLSIFMTFNAVVPVHQLTRLVPAALHEMGIVVLVAITYIPETARHYQRIKEAQAIRGHRLRGLRDWQPILIPLLVGSLERSLSVAETMVARGYGKTGPASLPNRMRFFLIAGLFLLVVGALRLAWQSMDGWLLLTIGVLFIAFVYRDLSQQTKRTNYRSNNWTRLDTAVVFLAIAALVLSTGILPGLDRDIIFYSPYPQLIIPPFDWRVGISLLGLAAPGILVLLP